MLYEDEDETGENPAEASSALPSETARIEFAATHPRLLRSFTRWLIGASWRTGRSNGASGGAGVPIRWKKAGSPGEMRRPRPSSKSGTSSATMLPEQSGEPQCLQRPPSETDSVAQEPCRRLVTISGNLTRSA